MALARLRNADAAGSGDRGPRRTWDAIRSQPYPGVVSASPRVPRAHEAVVPQEKLAGYALNSAHPRGCHKARVFSSALGIDRADWRYLRHQLIEGVAQAPVLGTRITPFGVLYEVLALVDGLNGTTAPVAAMRTTVRPGSSRPGWTSRDQMPHSQTVTEPRHTLLDVVELLAASGRWPAGTTGTVVEADDQHALVEITDDRGHASDFVSLPHDKLASADHHSAHAAS